MLQQLRPTQVRLLANVVVRNLLSRSASSHTERKIKVDGVDINVVCTGNGEQSLLLMPGALGSAWTDFKPQIEKLPQLLPNYTIVAWDPPGYGKSIPPQRRFGLEFYREDASCALNLMRSMDREKFSILGWSDGGITALILAARFAECVEKLVIWGAAAYIIEAEVKAVQEIRDVSKWSPRMREPMEKVYGVQRFSELWSEWVDAEVAFYTHRHGDFCRKEVAQVRAPTFILHGSKDPMVAAEHFPYLKEHIRGCRYHEFPDGKHNIHLRYADEFNRLVAEFLLATK